MNIYEHIHGDGHKCNKIHNACAHVPSRHFSCMYRTFILTLRAAASMISVFEYRYGGGRLTIVYVANLVFSLGIILYEHVRPPFDVLFVVRTCHGRNGQIM